jgi:CspA family cold shock protein
MINQINSNRFERSKHKKNKMNKGTVKFYNEAKGFGFITNEETGKEVFVHATGLIGEIREGEKVEYEEENGKKGLTAVNVRVIR